MKDDYSTNSRCLTYTVRSLFKGWENVLFELRRERVNDTAVLFRPFTCAHDHSRKDWSPSHHDAMVHVGSGVHGRWPSWIHLFSHCEKKKKRWGVTLLWYIISNKYGKSFNRVSAGSGSDTHLAISHLWFCGLWLVRCKTYWQKYFDHIAFGQVPKQGEECRSFLGRSSLRRVYFLCLASWGYTTSSNWAGANKENGGLTGKVWKSHAITLKPKKRIWSSKLKIWGEYLTCACSQLPLIFRAFFNQNYLRDGHCSNIYDWQTVRTLPVPALLESDITAHLTY